MSPIPCYVCSYSFCIYAHNFCINSGKKKKGLGYVMCVCGERGSLKSKEIPPGREANETWKGIKVNYKEIFEIKQRKRCVRLTIFLKFLQEQYFFSHNQTKD